MFADQEGLVASLARDVCQSEGTSDSELRVQYRDRLCGIGLADCERLEFEDQQEEEVRTVLYLRFWCSVGTLDL